MADRTINTVKEFTLLVEGDDDRKFFETLFSITPGFDKNQISIDPPKSQREIHRNGINNLLKSLPLYIDLKLRKNDIKRFGIVIDADSEDFGFNKRREQITGILAKHGYIIPDSPPDKSGELFTHPEGFTPVGLWIMPNHSDDGIFEDCLLSSIQDGKQTKLVNTAKQAISALGEQQLFRPKHLSKAQISTWLAWQTSPGMSAAYAYHQNLFDRDHQNIAALINWLESVFQHNENQ